MKTRLFAILLCLVTITACAKEDNKQNDASATTTYENNDEVSTESALETTEDNEDDSDDVFKKYRDELQDWHTAVPLSEADKMIADKEKADGLTDEIKNGKIADWKKLDYTLTR